MFAIDQDNSISYRGTLRLNDSDFDSLAGLSAYAQAEEWSKQDVTDIWNSFAGTAGPFADLKPQKCFRNRPHGLRKLWEAIQRLVPKDAATEAETPADAILEGDLEKETPVKEKKAVKKAKSEKVVKGKSKRDEVIRLISRAKGASVEELLEATGWLGHSLRGMISTLGSKGGLKIESTKHETKGRVYRLVA